MRNSILLVKILLLVPIIALAFAGCGAGGPTVTTGGSSGPAADTTPPSSPTALTATAAGSTGINLAWNASTDNVGVTGYIIRRNGTQIATPTATNYADTGLTAATTYNYTVAARDAAGNVSPTASASGTTAAPSSDTTSPTQPTNLAATAAGSTGINLTWTASTDNIGVVDYIVRRDGTPVGTPTTNSFADSGLSAATTYNYTAQARDAAGNVSLLSAVATATTAAATGTLPLGALVHDGPATPEQISLVLPVQGGSLPLAATASVRYRPTGSPTWITGHSMHRIRPSFSNSPAAGNVPDAFAWPIIDLAPGTSYDIEVTVNSGATTEVKTLTHTTRALPAAAGAVTTSIASGSTAAQISAAINNPASGNVIEIQNGTYNLSTNIQLNRSGTANNPIYIRGQSRAGVMLSNAARVFNIQNASHVVIENLTIQGSVVDSGTNSSSKGIEFTTASLQTRVTIRNVIMNGVDMGIVAHSAIQEFLAYDNTLNGNNLWTPAFIDTNITWNDDGIRIPGFGNCAFNNTLKGFGDTLSYANHSGGDTLTESIGTHFYRNDVLMGGDDLAEADHSHRNNTFYDNRSRNTMTFISLDPIYGGPLLVARNIAINTGRSPYKMNNQNSGQFIYNNTIIRTTGRSPHDVWGEVQFNNGPQRSWGYQNNILVYLGSGGLLAIESGGNDPVDITHNSWYPNGSIWWTNSGGTFSSLANAYSGLPTTTPVFSGQTKRHEQDNITISNPWTVTVTLGANYYTEVTTAYTPALSASTSPKNSGTVIPNITDGFSGAAPDRGAIIQGRTIPQYGNRSP